jgi:hypothetical protein
MPTPGAVSAGTPITPGTGSAKVVVARDGVLLGWWAAATGSVVLNDVATTAGVAAGNQILTTSACAVGWNPFPVVFVNGLVVNAAAATTICLVVI